MHVEIAGPASYGTDARILPRSWRGRIFDLGPLLRNPAESRLRNRPPGRRNREVQRTAQLGAWSSVARSTVRIEAVPTWRVHRVLPSASTGDWQRRTSRFRAEPQSKQRRRGKEG